MCKGQSEGSADATTEVTTIVALALPVLLNRVGVGGGRNVAALIALDPGTPLSMWDLEPSFRGYQSDSTEEGSDPAASATSMSVGRTGAVAGATAAPCGLVQVMTEPSLRTSFRRRRALACSQRLVHSLAWPRRATGTPLIVL